MTYKHGSCVLASLWLAGVCPLVLAQDAPSPQKINDAIDKGVAYLKRYAGDAETKQPGSWALRGWALLESGVAAGDADVKKLAAYVRQQVPEMDNVYDLSLSIIFLDKLADAGDEPLIESMAVRLLAGQGTRGGWDYGVDKPHAAERARLAKLVQDSEQLRSQGLVIRARSRTPQEIAQDVSRQLKTIRVSTVDHLGNNSTTQFAMMAIWVARRHGLPAANCLALVEKRFQLSQVKSGTWGYFYPTREPPDDDNMHTYPAMTCAGLLGLALGEGVKAKPRDLTKDPQVQRGLAILAQAMVEPPPGKRPNFIYFLFSMERTAVVYNLKKIGDHDWYAWGAQKLVETQQKDGWWSAGFSRDAADTCFALLFLKRANVAKDLTEILGTPIRRGPDSKKAEVKKAPG
jgi:hypothetical protein